MSYEWLETRSPTRLSRGFLQQIPLKGDGETKKIKKPEEVRRQKQAPTGRLESVRIFTWLKVAPDVSAGLMQPGASTVVSHLQAEGVQGSQMFSRRQDVGDALLVRVAAFPRDQVQVVQDEVEHAIIQD